MSRGTTLTLYRVYRGFKVSKEQYELAMAGYRRLSDECRRTFDPNDIPLVMAIKPFDEYETDKTGVRRHIEPRNIEEFRARHYCGFFLRDDRYWCDRLLEWNFTSGFNALMEHYSLDYYSYRNREVRISKEEAGQMLSAIEYILGGVWDDQLAAAMHNPFVHMFTEGYEWTSYWKYVNRKHLSPAQKVLDFEQKGCHINIRLPPMKKTCEDYECEEDDADVEYWLRTFSSGLRAFLESDN